jgi:hypothetical protein
MHTIYAFLILAAPFAIAALLSWASHRSQPARNYLASVSDDRDWYRVEHDAEAARTRFEKTPAWPASGVSGERR